MALVSVALMSLVGCGGGGDAVRTKERRVCAHVDKLCGGDPTPADECAKDLRELKEPAGETYDKFLDCTLESKTCPEFAGCFIGGLSEVGEQWKHQFERGVDRMKPSRTRDPVVSPREDDSWSSDDSTLPAECRPITETCSTSERIVRKECREYTANLRKDPARRGRLGECISDANNCFAIKKCLTDLWFEMH